MLDAAGKIGFCLEIAGTLLQPDLGPLLAPGFQSAAEVLRDKIVLQYRRTPFENQGVEQYIVNAARPNAPNKANRISLKDGNYVRADVRIYFLKG